MVGLDELVPAPRVPVVVAVIDSGIDYLHEDIDPASLWRNRAETDNGVDDDDNGFVDDLAGWNFADQNNNPWDDNGHGTHVAGIIGAIRNNGIGIAGINPAVSIMALKVANSDGYAKSARIAAAIYYAVDHGAKVINLSMSGEVPTAVTLEALRYAEQNDVLVVAAAGNFAASAEAGGYAAVDSVLAVGALTADNKRARFSNVGANVDVMAPGTDVLSLRARDTDFILLTDAPGYQPGAAVVAQDYYLASGTSFAAAIVSGGASFLMSARPALSARQIRRVIEQTALDLGAPGHDDVSGFGVLNLAGALFGDPRRYVKAQLEQVKVRYASGKVLIDVYGRAEASMFEQATLAVQAVDGTWQPVGDIPTEVTRGRLASIDLETLLAVNSRELQWRLQLTVHGDAGSRRAHTDLNVPLPE